MYTAETKSSNKNFKSDQIKGTLITEEQQMYFQHRL